MTQSIVRLTQAFGVPGDVYDDSPRRALPYILDSATDLNLVGNAFSIVAEGHATIGGDAARFAGILINSKAYVGVGTVAGGTLAPTLNVPTESEGELMTMGRITVTLSTSTNNIDNIVYYDDVTGALGSAASVVPAGNTQIPNAVVDIFDVALPGLAVIKLTT